MWAFLIVGILFVAAAILWVIHRLNILITGVKSTAVIIDSATYGRAAGRYHSSADFPTIVYHVNGKKYETTTNSGKTFGSWNAGDTVVIYYKKNNPEKVIMRKGMGKWCFKIFLLVLIGAMLIFGAYVNWGV